MQINGPSRATLDEAGDHYAELVTKQLGAMLDEVARMWKPTSHLDDLAVIQRLWTERVHNELLPALHDEYVAGSGQIRDTVQEIRLTASLTAAIPNPYYNADQAAVDYMASATNRLVGIGDLTWAHVRDTVQQGLAAGTAHQKVAASIASDTTLGIVQPRAGVIARTETVGARNRGALAQMSAYGFTDTTKKWLATNDHRTRPSHRDANGQQVGIDEKFTVGGTEMDGPHDPTAPAREVVNCRCTLTYALPEHEIAPPFTLRKDQWDDLYARSLAGDRQAKATLDAALNNQAQILRSADPFADAQIYLDNPENMPAYRRTGVRTLGDTLDNGEIHLSTDVWNKDRHEWDRLFKKADRAGYGDNVSWFAPVEVEITGPDYIAHHEMAHYLEQTFAANEDQVKAQLAPIAYEIGGDLGVEEMEANPQAWVQAHTSAISKAVSAYASAGVDELLAELWAWYSLDPSGAPAFVVQSASILVEFINVGTGSPLDYLKGLAGRKVLVRGPHR